MRSTYNQIAGQNLGRLAALGDGIFGVAMTLLVFDLKPPTAEGIETDADLAWALLGVGRQLVLVALSFLTLGVFWVAHQTQLHHLDHGDRHFTWLQLAYFFTATMIPFATRVLVDFPGSRLAVVLYWLLIVVLGGLVLVNWIYAERAGLVRDDAGPAIGRAIRSRVRTAQLLYFGAVTVALISPRLSIAAFVIIQLGYALGLSFHLGRSAPRREERESS